MSNILLNNEEEIVGYGTYKKYPYTITKRKYTNYNLYTIRCDSIDGFSPTARTIESAMDIFKANVDSFMLVQTRFV